MNAYEKTLLSIAVALALTACGGGGGGGPAPVTPLPSPGNVGTSSGKAVDGYLSGALALCDTNNNGVKDAGETVVTTGLQGDFTFPSACASTMVVWGGTNSDGTGDFKGRLKAPAGSAVATPLTSLMVDGGLTAAQVAAAFRLPDGTDVSTTDPMTNLDLRKKTLVMQRIIEEVASTLGGMAKNTSPVAIQAIYSEVAKAVATTLLTSFTTPLLDASGNISASLVFGILQQSVRNVATTTDTSLATVRASLSEISADNVAVIFSSAITGNAEILAKASNVSVLIEQTKLLRANHTLENAASGLASLLTTANARNVSLTELGRALKLLSDTDSGNDPAATDLAALIAAQFAAAGIAQPTLAPATWPEPGNHLAIVGDNIVLNGVTSPLSQFLTGITLASKPDTVSFAYKVNGTPIPAGGSQVSVGMELTESATGRVLQVILDQVTMSVLNGQLSVTVPAGAKLYIYGKTANGSSANLTLANDLANPLTSSNGTNLTFNATNVLNSIATSVGAQPGSPFANLQAAKGTFNFKVVVSNLNIQSETVGAVKGLAVLVTGSGQAITGSGVEGKFTVN